MFRSILAAVIVLGASASAFAADPELSIDFSSFGIPMTVQAIPAIFSGDDRFLLEGVQVSAEGVVTLAFDDQKIELGTVEIPALEQLQYGGHRPLRLKEGIQAKVKNQNFIAAPDVVFDFPYPPFVGVRRMRRSELELRTAEQTVLIKVSRLQARSTHEYQGQHFVDWSDDENLDATITAKKNER